ncbi:MAG: ABC transporter substrate-binding protein [Chloroflexota bacterium]
MNRTTKRRTNLLLGLFVIMALMVAACGGSAATTPTDEPAAPEPAAGERIEGAPDTTYNESPMLAERVVAGDLSSVDERLPNNPAIIEPLERAGETIGQYGGKLTVTGLDPNGDSFGGDWGDGGGFRAEGLATFDIADRTFVPNIAESWEVSDDFTTLTVHLREGIRWSDGELLTTEDVEFWWNDIMLNENLTAKLPNYFAPDDQPMTVNIIDDFTFNFQYAEPYLALADQMDRLQPFSPKHYMEKWHIDYNPDAGTEADAEGFGEWFEAFLARHEDSRSIVYAGERPFFGPFIPGVADSVGTRLSERNPYYWKVDSAGNQLPYVDYYERILVGSREILEAKAIAGEYNMGGAWADLANFPLLVENAEQAGYTVRMFPGLLWGGSVSWAYNYTSNDPVLREIFNDLRFRKAMSYAINRVEFGEVFNLGLTEPRQAAPPADWSFYDESMGRNYLEYDVELANQLLDEMGLEWDADGERRLRPDGEPLILNTEIGEEGHRPGEWEFIVRYWLEIGIEVKFKQVDQGLYAQRLLANELDIGTWGAGGPPESVSHAIFPIRLVPPWHWRTCCALGGMAWHDWWDSGGELGEVPPEEIQELFGILDQWRAEPIGSPEYESLAKEMVRMNDENIWYNVVTGSPPSISHAVVVSAIDNSVKNVRDPDSDSGWWMIERLWIDE